MMMQVKAICEELQCGFLGVGFDPKWKIPEIPMMPKGRYKLMKAYMPTVGTMGLDMMFRTCTVQVRGEGWRGGGRWCRLTRSRPHPWTWAWLCTWSWHATCEV